MATRIASSARPGRGRTPRPRGEVRALIERGPRSLFSYFRALRLSTIAIAARVGLEHLRRDSLLRIPGGERTCIDDDARYLSLGCCRVAGNDRLATTGGVGAAHEIELDSSDVPWATARLGSDDINPSAYAASGGHLSDREVASIHGQGSSGHPGRFIARQIDRHTGNILRSAEPADGMRSGSFPTNRCWIRSVADDRRS